MSKYDKDLCRHVHIISSQHLSLDATLIQCQDHHSSGRKQGGFSSQVMTQERVHRGATSESVYIYVTSIYIIYMECRHWCRNHLGWEQTPMQEPPPCGNHPRAGTTPLEEHTVTYIYRSSMIPNVSLCTHFTLLAKPTAADL